MTVVISDDEARSTGTAVRYDGASCLIFATSFFFDSVRSKVEQKSIAPKRTDGRTRSLSAA